MGHPLRKNYEFRVRFCEEFQHLIKEFITLKQDLQLLSQENRKKNKKRKIKEIDKSHTQENKHTDVINAVNSLPDIDEIEELKHDFHQLSQEFFHKKVKTDSNHDTRIVIKR